MEIHVYIQNGQTVYEPVVLGSISWETKRKGEPGKCSFTLLADHILDIEEGNGIRVDVEGQAVFFGFIFERSWGSDGQVKVTAYDQLRYLKNKDSYCYENKTAAEVIRMIAEDYHLQVGELEDTGWVIEKRTEKDVALFDIILNAIDYTMIHKGKIYVFYDDIGKLTLKDAENMKLSVAVDSSTAGDYDYKISIDGETYNQIKLYHEKENEHREIYMTKHTENINKWGVLQLTESIDDKTDGQELAERYLKLYNKPVKSLSIKDVFGDIQVRAGCLIPVFLNIRDMELKNYLLVEAVTHKINEGVHTMDLTLKGVDIFG